LIEQKNHFSFPKK